MGTRWREFRTRVLPVLMALGIAAAAAWLWFSSAVSANFTGIVEGARAAVATPQPAALRQLLVRPYQWVEAGDPVAVVVPTDPQAALDLLQTELDLARFGLEPSVPEQNALEYERLRFEWLRMKSELATDAVQLELAENQVRRQRPLFEQKLVSEDLYDLSAKTRDSMRAEVNAKTEAVAKMEQRLEALRPIGEPQEKAAANPAAAMLASLRARHQANLTNWGPITLSAPMAGMVIAVQRRPGENLLQGDPILWIGSAQPERVVGYLRQPYPFTPRPGAAALVSTREWKRAQYRGTVSQVGAQIEYITNSLAAVRPGSLVDSGLPIVIELPPEASMRPGEVVDIAIQEPFGAAISNLAPIASLLRPDGKP